MNVFVLVYFTKFHTKRVEFFSRKPFPLHYSFEKKHEYFYEVFVVRADDKIKSPLGNSLGSINIFLYEHGQCFDFMMLTFTLTLFNYLHPIIYNSQSTKLYDNDDSSLL